MMMSPYAMRWCRDLRISSMICSVVFGLSGFGAGARTEAATGAGWSLLFQFCLLLHGLLSNPRHLRMDSPCSLDLGQRSVGLCAAWNPRYPLVFKELAREASP